MRKRISESLRQSARLRFLKRFFQRIKFPGGDGTSVYDVLIFFLHGMRKGSISTRASSMAFHFFLAIFPSIIFLFTLIPYIPVENFQSQLMNILKDIMPGSAYEAAESTLTEIITKENGGLLSFGFLAALYFSTNGFNAMIVAFNKSYHSMESRSALMTRLVSLFLVLIISFLIVAGVTLIIISEYVTKKTISQDDFGSLVLRYGRWALIFILVFSVISTIYYLGPSRKKSWKFFSPGSTAATLLSLLTSLGFAFYVNNFGQYNKLYGSIGTLIVILLWIYFNSLVLLVGFELNVSIHMARQKSLKPSGNL